MPTATLLQSGDALGGFRVEDVIGIGGMAIVYRAVQVSLGRPVALKVLSSELTGDGIFRERFRREGTHAAALEHPNIVPVYDSGEDHGHLYLAMRLVEGTNLAEVIKQGGLTLEQTIEILGPIASALDSAHADDLIHRDVKPQNILIARNGHPYLTDFGIAKRSSGQSLTQNGWFVGSVNFASPEQIDDLSLTPASDIYALTAVLFQCLTGEVPYSCTSDAAVMRAHLSEPPPRLPQGGGGELDAVFARGMAKDPAARYTRAGDLIDALRLCMSRLPDSVRRSTNPFAPARDGEDGWSKTAVTPLEDATGGTTYSPLEPEPEAPSDDEWVRPRITPRRSVEEESAPPATRMQPQFVTGFRDVRKSRRYRLWALASGAVGILIATAGVLLLGGSSHANASMLRSGNLLITTEGHWQPSHSALQGLVLKSPIAIATSDTKLTAGAVQHPSLVAGEVPDSLVALYGEPTQSNVVELPLGLARRFTWSGPRLTPLTVWALATGTGELAIACSTESTAAVTQSQAACSALVARARVTNTTVEYPGADPELARQLDVILTARRAALSSAGAGLLSGRLTERAVALSEIAAADSKAANGLARVISTARYRSVLDTLSGALSAEASAVHGTADAARHGKRGLYESLRRGVRSKSGRLRSAVSALSARGFDLPMVSAPTTRALPAEVQTGASSSGSATPVVPTETAGSTSTDGGGTRVVTPSPGPAHHKKEVRVPIEIKVPVTR